MQPDPSKTVVNAVVQAALAKETSARRNDASSGGRFSPRILPAGHRDTVCRVRSATCTILPISMSARPASTMSACRRSSPKFRHECRRLALIPVPDTAVMEQEREEFLRQFKSQLLEAHAEVVGAPESICKFREHHTGEAGQR